MGQRLYFSSEGRRAEDFFALKNPTASAGFELIFSKLHNIPNRYDDLRRYRIMLYVIILERFIFTILTDIPIFFFH